MPLQPPTLFDYGAAPRHDSRPTDAKGARRVGQTGVALALLGLLIGLRPLFGCGCALLCLALLARIWVRAGVRGVVARRRVLERQVVEGELMEAVIEVSGRRARLFGIRVVDSFSGGRLTLDGQEWMPTGRGARERLVVAKAGRRGMHRFDPPLVTLDDPLGLVMAQGQQHASPDEVLVLPRTETIEWTVWGWRAVGAEHHLGRAVFGAGEVDGLREYQSGTPATRIHWPSLARGGGLLERRIVAAAETRPTIVLDARSSTTEAGAERLDAAVRAAASLARELARHGGCSLLLPGARVPFVLGHNLQGWSVLHTQLALVEARWYAGPAPTLRPEQLRGPVLYVGAGEATPPPIMSPYQVIHVRPLEQDDERPLFEVAGCGGYLLRRHGRTAA